MEVLLLIKMVQGSFMLSVYKKKGEQEIRRVNFRQTTNRFFVVVIAIFVVLGCEYCFDNPSALQKAIMLNSKRGGKEQLGETEFNLLYSLYAFPNVLIPLLGGYFIDRIGARIVVIVTAGFCVVGQMIFGFGGYQNSFMLMLAGRIVFGLGGQVLHASQNTIISSWFKASELSIVLGICISFPKMGSSLNSYVSPIIGEMFETSKPGQFLNVAGPIFVGLIVMAISLFLAVILAYIDKKNEKEELIHHQSALLSGADNYKRRSRNFASHNQTVKVEVTSKSQINGNSVEMPEGSEHLHCKDIKELPITFWLIIFISMLSEALFIPFLDNGNLYYMTVFDITSEEAGIYLIMPYCVSSVFVLIFGYFVEKVSKRSYVLIGSCFFYTFTYLFMMYLETNPEMRAMQIFRWAPCFLLGICIALFCSVIVPTIPMLVRPNQLGTAFGIMEMLQNLALGVFPLLAGALREMKGSELAGFHYQTLFFFLVSCLCFSAAIFLKMADVLTGSRLDIKNFRKQYIKKVQKNEID